MYSLNATISHRPGKVFRAMKRSWNMQFEAFAGVFEKQEVGMVWQDYGLFGAIFMGITRFN